MTTRKQHYVWRYYLEGWNRGNGQVYCLRNGNRDPFSTNPKNIMAERDFYRLLSFTKEDIGFFENWLQTKCEPPMRDSNQSFFNDFKKIAGANELLRKMGSVPEKDKLWIRNLVIELEENLHGDMENRALPLLGELRKEHLHFLKNDTSAVSFFQFIAHQYFRTKGMREKIGEVLSNLSPGYDFNRLRHVFCYCFGDNFGGSLYCDRKRLEFIFLKDRSNGLITGDQPILNLVRYESLEHDDVALYYPLRPNLAVLITVSKILCSSLEISKEVVKRLNETIAFSADQFLVGASEESLREFNIKPLKQPEVLRLLSHR